jgi:ComF family protein
MKTAGVCSVCHENPPPYVALRSWAIFNGPLRKALHRLKYARDISLGEVLARPLVQLLAQLQWKFDLVTPVPVGVARRAERGYNQAAFLARPLALRRGIKYQPRALKKIRETRSQVGLTYSQRLENVADAFCSDSNLVGNRIILVVDDVTTSGATMVSCAKALLIAGAKSVFGLTLARTAHPAQFG